MSKDVIGTVLVVGGGPGGLAAALASAREGVDTMLVERYGCFGGNITQSMIGSIVLVAVFSHLFELVILIIFLLFFKIPLIGLLVYPLILILFSIFSLGVSLILSSIAVYFVDLDNIWMFASRLLWLGTPILWSLEKDSKIYVKVFEMINPLYYFITLTRHIVVYHESPPLWIIFGTLGFTFLSITLGLLVFKISSKKIAEMV